MPPVVSTSKAARILATRQPWPGPVDGDARLAAVIVDIRRRAPAWHRDALCREFPALDFFPGQGEPLDPARAVCARCLVRAECFGYAVTHDDRLLGVWAGTSYRERTRPDCSHVA
jgi:hypothetical protein